MNITTKIKSLLAAAVAVVGLTAISTPASEEDFLFDDGEITMYLGFDEDVEIPATIGGQAVTAIGEDAFCFNSWLKNVTIPSGVGSIGGHAFYSCSSLESVTIPEGVWSIGSFAFLDCGSLQSVTIPSTVTQIGNYTFDRCISLQSATILADVTTIPTSMFENCSKLKSVTFPEGVTKIGDNAFKGCGFQSMTIPSSVTSIGTSAFAGCGSGRMSVNVEAANPPAAGDSIFGDVEDEFEITVPKASVATYKAAAGWSDYKDYINKDPAVTVNKIATVSPWKSTKGTIKIDYTLAGLDPETDYKVAFDVTAGGTTAGVTNVAQRLTKGAATKTIDTAQLFGKETVDTKAKVKVSLIAVKPKAN